MAVECEPPAETGFSASVGEAPSAVGALLDGDGDGVFTTSLPVERGTVQGARIDRLDPISDEPQAPLVATTIEDFGPVLFDEDKTFEASISFCDGDGGSGGGPGTLPATGGVSPIAVLAGALLLAGGLLARRISR
ncbi:LPXTG cell wall anchor domain-containing protein [Rubrobacter marinus]|uniref:LPXTG cell wall anchor domain-containing protein n=1 Tax=Rubrobacter marinus TaxID=2653852 RepID=A0A6G8Q372_9ACTN|nr:LPXTG cell wall anchor domain-containing protein [Rubrobacter marinus]